MESKKFLIEKHRKQQQTVASCKIQEIAKYIFQKWRVAVFRWKKCYTYVLSYTILWKLHICMYLFIWQVKTDRNIFCILLFLEWMVNVLRSCPFVHLFDNPFQNSPYCQEVIKKNHRIADIFFIPFIFQSHLINLNHSCLGII